MKLTVNGETMELVGVRTVADLLEKLRLGAAAGGRRVAVAVNLQVVPQAEHDRSPLQEDDQVEIIQAVGGGS
ncbi:MAG: sulfur carrier protein ThiS [Deltaproteobacteria bacterium]|nr:sulfur carrier protein ThiS [Deltaproteobacteria bacterium]